jgi:hypothetical protein
MVLVEKRVSSLRGPSAPPSPEMTQSSWGGREMLFWFTGEVLAGFHLDLHVAVLGMGGAMVAGVFDHSVVSG